MPKKVVRRISANGKAGANRKAGVKNTRVGGAKARVSKVSITRGSKSVPGKSLIFYKNR